MGVRATRIPLRVSVTSAIKRQSKNNGQSRPHCNADGNVLECDSQCHTDGDTDKDAKGELVGIARSCHGLSIAGSEGQMKRPAEGDRQGVWNVRAIRSD